MEFPTFSEFVHTTTFVIDAHARRIPAFAGAGWRVSNALRTEVGASTGFPWVADMSRE